ncbi:MAG: hypothetical protein AB7P04_09885 [Bacteriovoracia bacterium]
MEFHNIGQRITPIFIVSLSVALGTAAWAVDSYASRCVQATIDQVLRRLPGEPTEVRRIWMPRNASSYSDEDWQELVTLGWDGRLTANRILEGRDAQGNLVTVIKFARSPLEAHGFRQVFEPGGLAKREVLAYDIDRLFGMGLVPRTSFGETSDGNIVTMQAYLKGYHDLGARPGWAERVPDADWQRCTLFDLMTGAIDRHEANLMINEDGRIALIDNGAMLSPHNRSGQVNLLERPEVIEAIHRPLSDDVKAQFLAVRWEELQKLMDRYEIPPEAQALAESRFVAIQAGLRANAPLAELRNKLAIRRGSPKTTTLIIGGAAVTGAVGVGVIRHYIDKSESKEKP